MSRLRSSEPDLLSSFEAHEDAMPSGSFTPGGVAPKPKKADRINLRVEDYPTAVNGAVSGSVGERASCVHRKVKKICGSTARLLRSMISSGVETIKVVSRSSTPVPDALAGPGLDRGFTCSNPVPESDIRAAFAAALQEVPWVSSGDTVGAAVAEGMNVQGVLDDIMAKLGGEGEGEGEDGDGGDYLGEVEGDGDAVLVTVHCWDGEGTGYIEMRDVSSRDRVEQNHDVSYAGNGF